MCVSVSVCVCECVSVCVRVCVCMAQLLKNLPAMRETRVLSLGWEDPLEKEKATHSSIPAWRISQRSLEGYSPWGHKESDMTMLCYAILSHFSRVRLCATP